MRIVPFNQRTPQLLSFPQARNSGNGHPTNCTRLGRGFAPDHGVVLHSVPRHRSWRSGAAASCAPGPWPWHLRCGPGRRSQFAASLVSRVWRAAAMAKAPNTPLWSAWSPQPRPGFSTLLSLRFVSTPATSVTILLLGRPCSRRGKLHHHGSAELGLTLAGPQTRARSWPGWGPRCTPPSPSRTGRHGPVRRLRLCRRSRSRRRWCRLPPCCWSPRSACRADNARRSGVDQSNRCRVGAGSRLALSSVGFGAITAFVSLLFAARGWTVWPAFTGVRSTFIFARVFLAILADRVGGARSPLICALIEAAVRR